MKKLYFAIVNSFILLLAGGITKIPIIDSNVADARCGCPVSWLPRSERCVYFFCIDGNRCTSLVKEERFKCKQSYEYINNWLTTHRCRKGIVRTDTWYERESKAKEVWQRLCNSSNYPDTLCRQLKANGTRGAIFFYNKKNFEGSVCIHAQKNIGESAVLNNIMNNRACSTIRSIYSCNVRWHLYNQINLSGASLSGSTSISDLSNHTFSCGSVKCHWSGATRSLKVSFEIITHGTLPTTQEPKSETPPRKTWYFVEVRCGGRDKMSVDGRAILGQLTCNCSWNDIETGRLYTSFIGSTIYQISESDYKKYDRLPMDIKRNLLEKRYCNASYSLRYSKHISLSLQKSGINDEEREIEMYTKECIENKACLYFRRFFKCLLNPKNNACLSLAGAFWIWANGEENNRDLKMFYLRSALHYSLLQCNSNIASGCDIYAALHDDRTKFPENYNCFVTNVYFQRACKLGNKDSCQKKRHCPLRP